MPSYVAARIYQQARLTLAHLRPARRAWTGLRILGYHRISDTRHPLSVRPEDFRRQMEAVLEAGLDVVGLAEALPGLEEPAESRRVAITFDDGYADLLDHALPVLRELRLPATVFVPTSLVGRRAFDWYPDHPPALSWTDIGELTAEGLVDVQSHGRTHAWLPAVDEQRARDEIAGSKRDLEEHLQYEITTFCFPAGLYRSRELELVREAGYRAAVTTDPGVNRGGTPLHRLRRTLVFWGDSPRGFDAKLSGLLDAPSLGHMLIQRKRARAKGGGVAPEVP